MKIVKFVKIAQNVKKLTLVFCAVLFLLPACKTPSSDTPLSAAREGENAAAETTAEKEVPVPESLSEMPSESAGSVSSAGAESADKAGEPQPLDRIVRAEPQVESLNAESGSDRLDVSEPAPASEVKPAERIKSESEKKKSTKSAEKIEPAVKIVRASNTPAQANTPVPARESTIEAAQTPSSPTIISRTANANAANAQPPAREKNMPSAGTASTPAVHSDSTPARVTPAQTPPTASSPRQTTGTAAARIQSAAVQTPTRQSAATSATTANIAENTPSAQSTIISRTDAAPAQASAGTASTPAAAQSSLREKGAASTETANTSTPVQSSAQTPTASSPRQTTGTAAARIQSAARSDSTPARVTPAQTPPTASSPRQTTGTATARIQAENTPSAQSAIINRPAAARSSAQTPATAAGTKRAESADLSAESGFGLSSEPEVELASEDGAGSSSETAVPAIVPRRSVNAKINQFIDIPYSGRKWIFLGETEATSPPVVRFVNRTFSGDDTLFSVQAKNPGKTVLHFYRQDALENTYIDDYVTVEVLDEKALGTTEHVRAAEIAFGQSASAQAAASSPAAAGLSDASKIAEVVPAASRTGSSAVSPGDRMQSESVQNVQSSNGASEKDSAEAEQLYAAAQKAFEEKRYNDSLTSLQEYEASAGEDSDKALILRARLYESDSEKRNIKAALEAYEKIVTFFPESVFWDEAKRRSTYLRRFYFDIR